MKTLLLAMMMTLSLSASANTTATSAFLSVVKAGDNKGVTPRGESCVISALRLQPGTLVVTAYAGSKQAVKFLSDDMEFYFKDFKKEFIQTERKDINSTSYIENIVRTTVVDANRVYVVVSNDLVLNRERQNETVECVINL